MNKSVFQYKKVVIKSWEAYPNEVA